MIMVNWTRPAVVPICHLRNCRGTFNFHCTCPCSKIKRRRSHRRRGQVHHHHHHHDWIVPTKFDTPIHWSESQRKEWLQYDSMVRSVARQERQWKLQLNKVQQLAFPNLKWEEFCWGFETARSRAFSGSSAGQFNPGIYAFTLLLVTALCCFGIGNLGTSCQWCGCSIFSNHSQRFCHSQILQKQGLCHLSRH